MSQIQVEVLHPDAVEVLGQLFVNGPTWDGNIVSKNGRGQLFRLGLASRVNGFAFLTEEGVTAAIEWDVKRSINERWYLKKRCH